MRMAFFYGHRNINIATKCSERFSLIIFFFLNVGYSISDFLGLRREFFFSVDITEYINEIFRYSCPSRDADQTEQACRFRAGGEKAADGFEGDRQQPSDD